MPSWHWRWESCLPESSGGEPRTAVVRAAEAVLAEVEVTRADWARADRSRCNPSRIRTHRTASRSLRHRRSHLQDIGTNPHTTWWLAARGPLRPVHVLTFLQLPSNRGSTPGRLMAGGSS
eukprot:7380394-Prymnesium_polylepis.1